MVRDLPSHLAVKRREKRVFNHDELKQKLQQLDTPNISLDEANEFEDEDADDTDEVAVKDSESDVEESLLRELARVKKEKAEEEARKLEEARAQTIKQFTANALLNSDYSLKLKWTEEAVFHNQAATEPPKDADEFVNDPVRNRAHYRFLQKYLHT
jgi:protein CWC15